MLRNDGIITIELLKEFNAGRQVAFEALRPIIDDLLQTSRRAP